MNKKHVALALAPMMAISLIGVISSTDAHAEPAVAPIYAMGALPPTENYLPAIPAPEASSLPDSIDLRQWAVPVGNQGTVGACVAWAIGYSMMGWYADKAGLNTRAFAPMYLYAQINKDPYGAISAGTTMQRMVAQGIDSQDDYMPQGNYDFATMPTPAQIANAANWRFTGVSQLFATMSGNAGTLAQNQIEAALATGEPAVITMYVRPGFENMPTDLNVADTDTTGERLGLHEVLAVGYDANGLIIENEWGTGWGAQGFGRISWDVVGRDVIEAWVADGLAAVSGSPKLSTTISTWMPGAPGGSTFVSTPSNTSWKVSSAPSWVTATPSVGFGLVTDTPKNGVNNDPVTLTAQSNTSGTTRTGTVVFSTTVGSPVATATIAVTQLAGLSSAPTLALGSSSLSLSSDAAGSVSELVSSNTSWEASSSQPWLTLSNPTGLGNTFVTFSAIPNSGVTRTATVTFRTTTGSPTASQTVTVTQPGAPGVVPTLNVTPATWVPGSGADSTAVNLTANSTWTATSSAPWLTIYYVSGYGDIFDHLYVTANTTPMDRQAIVTFTTTAGTPAASKTVTVTQPGDSTAVTPSLTLSTSSWSMPSASTASTSLTVTSNTTWSASSNATWATVSPTTGTGNGSITITGQANTSTTTRTATITITTTNGSPTVARTITITQPGAIVESITASFSEASIGLPYPATIPITVTSTTTWAASSDVSWVVMTPSTGPQGSTAIRIMVQENTSSEPRTAHVTFKTTGSTQNATYTVTINQVGDSTAVTPSLTVNMSTWNPPVALSVYTYVTVTANASWSASSNATWVTLSPSTGSGNSTVMITLAANTSTTTRTATITITTTNGSPAVTRTITITQPGAASGG